MEAVIYTRVSSDQNEGRSVQDQERECRAFCERQGWPVRNAYCDNDIGASRWSKKDRPQWAELKRALRPGDILVCWEASRSTRDVEEHLVLQNLCAELGVPLSYGGRQLNMNDADDRFVGVLDAALSARESDKLRERVLRGRRGAAAAGRPGSRPPWGYRSVGRAEWEIDPVEGPRIKSAVERVLRGESQRSVYEWLKATGHAPGNQSSMRRNMTNPAIAGLRVHQGTVVGAGNWPAIISVEQHERLVAFLRRQVRERGFASSPGPVPKHLLSGVARCGVCDAGVAFRGRKGRRPTYRCPVGHVERDAVLLDGLVIGELVKDYLAHGDPQPADNPDVQGVRDEIAELEDQLAAFEAQAVARQISATSFARIERGLRARIDELKPLTVEGLPADPYELIRDYVGGIGALVAEGRIVELKELIRSRLLVTINKSTSGRWTRLRDVVITPR